MSRSDQKHCGLLALTGETSGHITDLEHLLLSQQTGLNSDRATMWHAYWDSVGVTAGHYNDRAFEWLGSLGHEGALPGRWNSFWTDQCEGGGEAPLPKGVLAFPLTHNLYGTVDGVDVTANFSRAAGPSSVEDFEFIVHECLDGEARFWKARRVENYQSLPWQPVAGITINEIASNHIEISGFTNVNADRLHKNWKDGADMSNGTYLYSYEIRVENPADDGLQCLIRFRNALAGTPDGDNTVTLPLTTEWVRHTQEITITEDLLLDGLGTWIYGHTIDLLTGAVGFRNWQVEEMTGTQTTESEYVDPDIDHGANALGVQYFNTDRERGVLTDLRYCEVEEGNPAFDPDSGIQGTLNSETLNVPLPDVLNQPTANDFNIDISSYTIRDNVDGVTTKLQWMIQGDSISNVVRLTSGTGGGRQFRKVVGGNVFNTDVAEGETISRRRNHKCELSSTDGMKLDIDGDVDRNPADFDMLTLDEGDGLLHIGSNNTGAQIADSGFGNVYVIDNDPP